MAVPPRSTDRRVAALALLFVLVFAAVLLVRYTPYGWEEPGGVLVGEARAVETVPLPLRGEAPDEAPVQIAQADDPAIEEPAIEEAPATDEAPVAEEPEPVVVEDANPRIVLTLDAGPVVIELRPDLAPLHVERILTLARDGFYDGVVFHRVIAGFMAQTGDPTGTGMGGSDLPDLPAEFSAEPFVRGVIGMARSMDPDSANSQFFITYADAPHLNGQYTVVGEVVSGMEHVDALEMGDPAANGLVADPDSIVSMVVDE